jgi:hypothetical protein
MRQIARMSSPEETSSTIEPVTSRTTSALRTRCCDRPGCRSAGSTPKPRPVMAISTAASVSTRKSRLGTSCSGSVVGTSCASSGRPAHARNTPAAPPMTASRTLSVTSCRTRRSRPAPRAVRIDSSRARLTPRASSSPARFAQARSRMHSDAPQSATSSRRERFAISSRRRRVQKVTSLFVSGYWRSRRAATVASSPRACSTVASGARRPTTLMYVSVRSSKSWPASTSEVHSSTSRFGKRNDGGITPMIVCCVPSSLTTRPMTPESPSN